MLLHYPRFDFDCRQDNHYGNFILRTRLDGSANYFVDLIREPRVILLNNHLKLIEGHFERFC